MTTQAPAPNRAYATRFNPPLPTGTAADSRLPGLTSAAGTFASSRPASTSKVAPVPSTGTINRLVTRPPMQAPRWSAVSRRLPACAGSKPARPNCRAATGQYNPLQKPHAAKAAANRP